MTGIVLALAGLAAGDGGPRMVATRGPLARSIAGDWEGSWLFLGQEGRAELRDGELRIHTNGGPQSFQIRVEGRRTFQMTNGRDFNSTGAFSVEGDRLNLSVTPGFRWPCRASGCRTLHITLKTTSARKR